MSKRQQAIQTLRQAQSLLEDHLTDLVVSERDRLLEEAAGAENPYLVESTILNQAIEINERLAKVGNMLRNLPPEIESDPTTPVSGQVVAMSSFPPSDEVPE